MNDLRLQDSDFDDTDRSFMAAALERAVQAEAAGEVPVGAVLVVDGSIAGTGWNRNISLNDPAAHAEIMALRAGGETLKNHRFPGATMYVTLEPCAMCVGAMIHARIERVIFAASDPKTGALGGAYDLQSVHRHNHRIEVRGGLMAAEASAMLRAFFRARRQSGGTDSP